MAARIPKASFSQPISSRMRSIRDAGIQEGGACSTLPGFVPRGRASGV